MIVRAVIISVPFTEYRHVGGPMTVTVNPTTDTPLVKLYQEAAVENGWEVTDCNGANMTGALAFIMYNIIEGEPVFVCIQINIVLRFCFVFLPLVYPMLPVSLDCPF